MEKKYCSQTFKIEGDILKKEFDSLPEVIRKLLPKKVELTDKIRIYGYGSFSYISPEPVEENKSSI